MGGTQTTCNAEFRLIMMEIGSARVTQLAVMGSVVIGDEVNGWERIVFIILRGSVW